MREAVVFTVEEAAELLEIGHETLLRYIRGRPGQPSRFPHAVLLHDSRSKGYRIPAGDLVEYARRQGPWITLRVERAIEARARHLEETGSPVELVNPF
jgi:hypothetical protein